MIDGQSEGDGLLADALVTDLTKQVVGAEVEAAATFGDGHDAGAEQVAAFGLAEEAGFPPDDVGPERSLGGIIREVGARCFEEAPEHGLIVQQGLAGMSGALSGMPVAALFQGRAEIDAAGE